MTRMPTLNALRVVRALIKAGFVRDRQKGSHLVMYNPVTGARTVVPIHKGKNIKRPLLYAIIKDAQLTPAKFSEYL